MGVAHREPPAGALLLSMLLVLASGTLVSAAQCERRVEASSPMFGAAWEDTFFMYTQDYNWKVSGDISKINMFYGMTEGCLKGIKAQYGPDPANAQRLGVETKALLTRSIQLKEGERIVRAEYKTGSKCIEYLSLRTNQGRQLAVGKPDSETPTQFAAPTNPNGYLGYFNGHTAKPMNSPNVGKLMQMQMVWVSNACEGEHSNAVSTAGATAAAAAAGGHQGHQAGHKKAASSSSTLKASIATAGSVDTDADSNTAKCSGNHLCQGGKCATSSCMLAGIGSEVPNMACHGTNIRLPILTSGIEMSPCSFLGCKLDTESCTSSGLMGVGGFCTGRVVATGAAAMLHPQGKQWLGYPCVEHKAAGLNLRASMLGELTSGQDMVAKSWKVCDCVKKTTSRNSLAVMMPNGTIASYIFGNSKQKQREEPTVAVPLMPVYEMGIKDVVTQWLAAKAGSAVLPTATIPSQLATDLKQLVPGFKTPSILIANTSAALMTHPEWMTDVPVFVLPNSALTALKSFIPDLTSLPTLALAPNTTTADVAAQLHLPKGLLVSDITVAALPALAQKLGLPTFLKLNPSTSSAFYKVDSKTDMGPHLVPLDKMHVGSVVVQWATAASRQAPLPTLVLSNKQQLEKLQAKVPGLVTPSIIVPNISHAMLFKPQNPGMPLFVLPSELSGEVMAMLPDITSLPSFLLLAEQSKKDLPKLHITDFIAPNMRVLVDTLSPSIPLLLNKSSNMTGPSLNLSMAGLVENPAMQAMMAMGPWGHLMSTVSGLPDLLVDASGLDMGSIKDVVTAVNEALSTTGFKLPYLSMNDDTMQKWGMKKIEGFVTNVVTRAVTPREDAGLINDSAADDSNADSDAGKKGGKNKQGRASAGKSSSEAQETAQGNKVAAVMSTLSDEQQQMDVDAESAAATKPRPPPKIKMIMPLPNATGVQPLTPEEQKQVDNIKKNQHARDVADDDYVEEEENITSVEKQKPKKPDTTLHSKSEPVVPKSAADGAAAAGAKPTVAQKASTDSSSKAKPGTKDQEPPAKPAYKSGATAQAPPPAAVAAAASPATSDSVPVPSSGVPVPVLSPPGAGNKKAGSSFAAAPAPAPKQQQKQQQQQQQQQQKPAAPAAKPQFPAGTLDEDGAMYVDESAASRAFMSEEQWAGVAPEHKDKLLKLLAVSDGEQHPY